MPSLFQCPCCDYLTLDARADYDICLGCFWEDDGDDFPHLDTPPGPNRTTLREARANFRHISACAPEMIPNVLPPAERTIYDRVERPW